MQEEKLVALLTEPQKDDLVGQIYAPDAYFNPIQDADDNWVISTQEQEFCTNPEFQWVKGLPLIPFKQRQDPGPNPGGI